MTQEITKLLDTAHFKTRPNDIRVLIEKKGKPFLGSAPTPKDVLPGFSALWADAFNDAFVAKMSALAGVDIVVKGGYVDEARHKKGLVAAYASLIKADQDSATRVNAFAENDLKAVAEHASAMATLVNERTIQHVTTELDMIRKHIPALEAALAAHENKPAKPASTPNVDMNTVLKDRKAFGI